MRKATSHHKEVMANIFDVVLSYLTAHEPRWYRDRHYHNKNKFWEMEQWGPKPMFLLLKLSQIEILKYGRPVKRAAVPLPSK